MRPVYVLGVGAHPWGKWPDTPQVGLAIHAMKAALTEASLDWRDLQGLVAASSRFEGGMGWGLHANELAQAVSEHGMACVNVGGACAAGAVAFHTAHMMVSSGQYDTVATLGAERMPKGFIPRPPGAADDPGDHDFLRWKTIGATNPAYWAMEARRRMHEVGTTEETFAAASVLMRRHGAHNPYARFRTPSTVEEVMASPMVSDPLRLLEICAVSDGAASVILGSEEQARRAGGPLIQVAGSAIATGQFGDPATRIPMVGSTPRPGVAHTSEVVGAVQKAWKQASIGPDDVDLLELADNTAWHVLAWPEMLGFFEPGESDRRLAGGDLQVGGRLPINPSGGFLSFGEATTAQALLQICELFWQLRGQAGGRQVENARIAMSAVLGLGANGGSVVLKR
jgi:acetyl-CoA acetyltransferase